MESLQRRFPNASRQVIIAALHAHDGDAAKVARELQQAAVYRYVPSAPGAVSVGTESVESVASTTESAEKAVAEFAPRPPPPLSHHLRALADRRASEVLPCELERLSPAATSQLEGRYKNTPYYNNNRPYVPLWRCLAAAFLEPLLLMLRKLPRNTSELKALVLCDLYWKNAIALPLMPLTALEALAQQHPNLVLKPQLAETDGSPEVERHVKLVLAVLPHVVGEAFHCV